MNFINLITYFQTSYQNHEAMKTIRNVLIANFQILKTIQLLVTISFNTETLFSIDASACIFPTQALKYFNW